jgi:long-chain acyl-CoA synthetase
VFRERVRQHPTQRAIVCSGRTVTFAEFDALSDRAAAGLAARGIERGDRVGLYCINSDSFAIAYLGIVKAGATVVPVNLLLNPKEIAYILNDAEAKALIYHEAFAANVKALEFQVPVLKFQVCIGDSKSAASDLDWPRFIDHPPLTIDHSSPEELAAILYTAGTTGHPKGAMLTHRNLVSNALSVNEMLRLTPGEDLILVVLPMFHAFAATAGMLFPLLHGCSLAPLPRFDPQHVADVIEREMVTVFMGVPSMYNVLLHLPPEYTSKLAPLKFCISGGAAMPGEIMRRFEARFGKLIYEGDGPTECSPVTSVNPIGGLRKPASIGVPVPSVEMKILDEQGRELPHGQIGEICVRGPNVMKGYWKRPKETAEAFFGEWFRTGDLGTEDSDGYFYIVDRRKDMIIVNGMNVYPRMVEEVLYRHETIREAAVVGEPHELHGEIPVAYVSMKDGHPTTATEIRAFCLESLGRHEVPRKVFFLPELPKNAAGKILKRELRTHGELERGVDSRAQK